MTPGEARTLCRRLFLETLDGLTVAPRMRSAMQASEGVLRIAEAEYPLSKISSVRLVSFGKAAVEMASAASEILHSLRVSGIVVSPSSAEDFQKPSRTEPPATLAANHQLKFFRAGHPYPDEQSWRAAEAALALLDVCTSQDLALFLISGGGSSLLELPVDCSLSLEDIRRLYELLVTCGASIQEINVVRKHLSAIKGGRLARRAAPAMQETLYVSDVPEASPSTVASGPTMPDESTIADCRRILESHHLVERLPGSIQRLLTSSLQETPKPGDRAFAQSRWHCLLSNKDAVDRALALAHDWGIESQAELGCDEWPFQRAADFLLARLESLRQAHPGDPVLLVSGGELSSPAQSGGRGGRNQAFVLDCVPKIAGKRIVVLSCGTDGIDGNSPAAGAIADGSTLEQASALGLNARELLARSDSFVFFEKAGGAVLTGPTGTNVRDLRFLLAY